MRNSPQALAALATVKNDRAAAMIHHILKNWLKEEVSLWASGIESAYSRTPTESTIGLFSNLPARLGEMPDDLPFMQVTVSTAPNRPVEKSNRVEFGLDEYFGKHLNDVSPMLVPFLTYAIVLKNEHKSKLLKVEVGDWSKHQPLVVTFKLPKQLIQLTVNGHILVKEAKMIAEAVRSVEEGAE